MARRATSRKKSETRHDLPPEALGLLLLAVALLTGLSLLSVNRGSITDEWVRFLTYLFGWGVYLTPLWLAWQGIWFLRRFAGEAAHERWEKPLGAAVLFLWLLVIFELIRPTATVFRGERVSAGGVIGWGVAELLRTGLGTAGSVVLLAGLALLSLVLISGLSLAEIINWLHPRSGDASQAEPERLLPGLDREPVMPLLEPSTQSASQPGFLKRLFAPRTQTAEDTPARPNGGGPPGSAGASTAVSRTATLSTSPGTPADSGPAGVLYPRIVGDQTWRLPPLESIFEEGVEQEVSQQEIRTQVRIIEETLASFGIEARVREINQGPAVTQFSIEPGYMDSKDAQGRPRKVRVARIVNLANDLALALSASPIRIEAPIPGRPYVGIEVPNATKSLVSLRSIMESGAFQNGRGILRFGLGRDVAGQPIVPDLAAMPHLLIAGATGSGKSVCINAIIASFLATHTPDTLRMILVDPKMVELVNYTGIPHLLAPVVTQLDRVVGVLNWAVREMERRYKIFSSSGVRNLAAYNEMRLSQGEKIMPYVVVIIDELADLMMTAPDEIEKTVTRIAQMARATGIHMILATQRPSVDVVTGLIKANFPARIAFAVTSQVDSRVILDAPGAERLLGRGDMLFMAPDSSKLQRLQGAYVSDRELARLVRFWKGTHMPDDLAAGTLGEFAPSWEVRGEDGRPVQPPLLPEVIDLDAETRPAASHDDDLLPRAIELVRAQGRASISLLQRRLRIGYARAARLIDLMEEQGIIGADEGGGRSRPVLAGPDSDAPTQGRA